MKRSHVLLLLHCSTRYQLHTYFEVYVHVQCTGRNQLQVSTRAVYSLLERGVPVFTRYEVAIHTAYEVRHVDGLCFDFFVITWPIDWVEITPEPDMTRSCVPAKNGKHRWKRNRSFEKRNKEGARASEYPPLNFGIGAHVPPNNSTFFLWYRCDYCCGV